MRALSIAGRPVDVGPTVLTMRWVFDRLFAEAGAALSDWVTLVRPPTGSPATPGPTAPASTSLPTSNGAPTRSAVSPARARREGYRRFCERAATIYETLRDEFHRRRERRRPPPVDRARRPGRRHRPHVALHVAVEGDRRAFHRSAAAPAVRPLRHLLRVVAVPRARRRCMLVAHVEREGVWLVEGGMARLAEALADLAEARGVEFRFGSEGCPHPDGGRPGRRRRDRRRRADRGGRRRVERRRRPRSRDGSARAGRQARRRRRGRRNGRCRR